MATLGNFTAAVLTAAELNAIGTWTNFDPTWTNLTVGNGTAVGRYCVINKVVFVNIELTFGSTTSVSGNVGVAAPTGTPARVCSLSVSYEDSGTRYYVASAVNISTTSRFELLHTESGNSGLVNATNPFTWATGDDIVISGVYVLT